MTESEALRLLQKAQAKADKYGAAVVLAVRGKYSSVQLLRGYSPERQDAIRAGSTGEFLIEPAQQAEG